MVTTLSTLDFLYLSLSVAVVILVIFICVMLVNLTLVLKDVRKITNVAGQVTEKFHGLVLKPIQVITKVVDAVSPHIEEYAKKQAGKLRKSKKN